MAGTAAGDRDEAGDGAAAAAGEPELARAVVDEANALRRDPRGYAEELAQLGPSGLLRDCLHDLRNTAPMPELTLSQAICRACQQHLADLQVHGHRSHLSEDGSTPEARLSQVGAHREQCGENLAFGAGSAKDVVHQMLADDGSVEGSQRANLLNPDFRFAGLAHGEHPSAGTATVLLLTDHFRAKQASRADVKRGVLVDVLGPEAQAAKAAAEGDDGAAQRSWDRLMQQAKPAHLKVPPRQRARVEFMASPKLYGKDRTKVPQFPLGDLQPRPSVDPAVARAFVYRLDSDQDDLITERDLEGLCYRRQLNISQADIAQMFDEIVQRRHVCERGRRAVDYAEVCAAAQPQKHWVPVMDIHVHRGDEQYQLIVDSEVFNTWSGDLYEEFAEKCKGLASPAPQLGGRNRSADVRVAELNTFLASVLAARLAGSGAPLQREPRVAALLGRPGPALDEASQEEFRSALCLGRRRLWSYRLRPHREAWLRLFRALDLHPLVPLAAGDRRPGEQPAEAEKAAGGEVSPVRSRNIARTPPRYYGIPAGAEKMAVRDPPQKINVRSEKTAPPAAPNASTKLLQPWQEKQQQIENSINKCVTLEAGAGPGGGAPRFGFEAQRKFTQVLYMQKHGISASETVPAERQPDGEPDALAREVGLSQRPGGGARGLGSSSPALAGTAARRPIGGSAPPAGQRGHGAGSHSLLAHNGVRSHFHNTVAIDAKDGLNGLSTLDMRWEGSHLDHTKVPPQKADASFSAMAPEVRAKQFFTYFKSASPDCAAVKARTASTRARDAEPYREWTQHDFRSDVPHRQGKHGRRHFDPQVREKPISNRHFISEIENKPQEEIERHSESVHDYLNRKLPEGQERHFQLHLPRSQQPSKFEELATHQPVRSTISDGVVKQHALGFGQMRHGGPSDPRLYARPLGASHMDRLIPLA